MVGAIISQNRAHCNRVSPMARSYRTTPETNRNVLGPRVVLLCRSSARPHAQTGSAVLLKGAPI